MLRRAGIAVDDIASFFAHPDAIQLDHWEREIVQASAARRQALAEARAALASGRTPSSTRAIIGTKGSDVTSTLVAGTTTHRGGREINQDAVLVADGLFAVADGVGGLAAGEVASRLALDTLDAAFALDRSIAGLLHAYHEANQAVWRRADREEATMGTTLVALAMTTDTAAVALHAGDSRLYRLRNGRLDQLTHDHTVIAELLRAGEISEAEAQTHPHRYVLTRAIGVDPDVDVDYAGVSCKSGDRLLLCTDGLFKALSADDVKAVLAARAEPQESADELVKSAVERGSEDNVTAMVIDVRQQPVLVR
ncbi:protein phosphatase 2C domain-containing protein [Saccharopolyspora sp. K220]|nr:protein phosphatase 2C domain-containing protein [Saccharopolyspora soli]